MSEARVNTEPKVEIQARVFRIDWSRKPGYCPKGLWLWLGKKRVSFTGRWENLGVIASSENGTATVQPRS